MRTCEQQATRIAQQRRAGIADQRHALTRGHARDERIGTRMLVVLVQRLERTRDAVVGEQATRAPGILGKHEIDLAQGLERPRRNVREVADGRRDDKQFTRSR